MAPMHVRILRGFLRRLNSLLRWRPPPAPNEPFDPALVKKAELALRGLPIANEAQAYFEEHVGRLARTIALAPPPQATGRVLELGCYMQITPFLQRLCGYREVRGAYYGPVGRIDRKAVAFPDGDFTCSIDHFDADRDRFPYPDSHFDLVIAAEMIEHLTYDPMHMLCECNRVLANGGFLLVTTPNVGSITSVAKTMDGRDNPQIFYLYKRPHPGQEPEIGHVREYTMWELGEAVKSAGFELTMLFTTFIAGFACHLPLLRFLEVNGYSTENRGEQTWCLARKRSGLPVDRYPFFLYGD